jgi:hypothetical protein
LLSKNLKIKIYKTIILPVVLYGCEAWLLTFREKRRLRVFEIRVLRSLFGPKGDEVTGEWRRALCSVLRTKCYSGKQIKKTEIGRSVVRMGERRDAYRALLGKPERRRPLGRPRRSWENDIKVDLREV